MKKDNTDPIDAFVGAAIKTRRRVIGMTQKELADPCGISFQQLQKYETGYNRVSASKLCIIADVLGVPIASLFPPTSAYPEMSEDANRAAYLYDKVDDPTKEIVKAILANASKDHDW